MSQWKQFTQQQLREAIQWASEGNIALHLHRIIVNRSTAPRCFILAIERGESIAHLFDQDKERLVRTAKKLGVNIVVLEREDTPNQHVDLCGKPLIRALNLCENI